MTLDSNDLDHPHKITVLLDGETTTTLLIDHAPFDGLSRQRIIVAVEEVANGTVTIEDDEHGEPIILVTTPDGQVITRGRIEVTKP